MNEFFFNLIKMNWGITFHFIFSLLLVELGYAWFKGKYEGYVLAGVFTLGGGYEIYQVFFEPQKSGDLLQDMLANLLGIVLAIGISKLYLRK